MGTVVRTEQHSSRLKESCNSPLELKLLEACKSRNVQRVQLLLEMGVSPNVRDACYGLHALTVAAIANTRGKDESQKQIVKILLSSGADPTLSDAKGRTVLHYCAMIAPNVDITETILQAANHIVLLRDEDGNTPLHVLCSSHITPPQEVVRCLLSFGANPCAHNNNLSTPFHKAAEEGNAQIVKIFLSNHANPNIEDKTRWTPLTLACNKFKPDKANEYTETISLLLDTGANPNIATARGTTPLYYSIVRKATRITELLLEQEAISHHRDDANRTLLHWVYNMWDSYPSWVDVKLLKAGANPNAVDNNGCVPIHYVLQKLCSLDYADDAAMYFTGKNPFLPSVFLNIQAGLDLGNIPLILLNKLAKFFIFSNNTHLLEVLNQCGLKYRRTENFGQDTLSSCMVSLQHSAGRVIRHSLKPNALVGVAMLPLPEKLKNEIILTDYF